MEWMEWVEDEDMRVFRTQGIVSVDACIPTFIARFRSVGYRQTTDVGESIVAEPRLLCSRQ